MVRELILNFDITVDKVNKEGSTQFLDSVCVQHKQRQMTRLQFAEEGSRGSGRLLLYGNSVHFEKSFVLFLQHQCDSRLCRNSADYDCYTQDLALRLTFL